MKIKKHLTIPLLLFHFFVLAQDTELDSQNPIMLQEKVLSIGDSVPNILIAKIINSSEAELNIFDFKDKLLILDFWATTCSGCVAALPRLEGLQSKFGDRIKILPVTFEKEFAVVSFLKKNRHTKNLTVSSVVEDTTLSKFFPHQFLAHEVWINKGKVIAITDGDFVDEKNIKSILNEEEINWRVKYDFHKPLNFNKPFLKIDTAQYLSKTDPFKYSALLGFRENPGYNSENPGTSYDTVRGTRRDFFINLTIPMAYLNYWQKIKRPKVQEGSLYYPAFILPNRLILEVEAKSKYLPFDEVGGYLSEWRFNNLICYESVVPDTGQSEGSRAKEIIADLDHLLGLEGRFETRNIKSLVLVRTSQKDKLKTKSKIRKIVFHTSKKIFRNSSLQEFVNQLNQKANNPPILNETGYSGMVDMELEVDFWTNISAIRKELQNYDLDLVEKERELEVFVITETK